MFAFRAFGFVLLAAMACCAGVYLVTGQERFLTWTWRLARLTGAMALIFFGILILERVPL